MLNSLELDYNLNLGEYFSLSLGPSYNVLVTSEILNAEYDTINIPQTVYEHEWTDTKLFSWFGFKVGFSYQI